MPLAFQNTNQFMQDMSLNAGTSNNKGGSNILVNKRGSFVVGGGCSYLTVDGQSIKVCDDGTNSF